MLRFPSSRSHTHLQIALLDGQKHFDGHLQHVVQRLVAVQLEHTKVDVVAAQDRLEHQETDGHALQAQRVLLVLGHFECNHAAAVRTDRLGRFAEQQNALGRGHVELDALRSIVDQFGE